MKLKETEYQCEMCGHVFQKGWSDKEAMSECIDNVCYETNEGRFFFKNKEEADEWFNNNYKDVSSGSVACSICGRAAIDNAMWL
jgi:hypothetical protein